MTRLLKSAYRVPILVVSAACFITLMAGIFGSINATRALSTLDLSDGELADVQVFLDFEPERFHLEKFQDVGRYLGWRDGYAVILKADPKLLQALARKYWITKIIEHVEQPS